MVYSPCVQLVCRQLSRYPGIVHALGDAVHVVQRLLALAHVPVQALGQRIEPVADLVLRADARHRIDGRGHAKATPPQKPERLAITGLATKKKKMRYKISYLSPCSSS